MNMMKPLIGPVLIAAVVAVAVAGALLYNGSEERMQRQCLAVVAADQRGKDSAVLIVEYGVRAGLTGSYCDGWARNKAEKRAVKAAPVTVEVLEFVRNAKAKRVKARKAKQERRKALAQKAIRLMWERESGQRSTVRPKD